MAQKTPQSEVPSWLKEATRLSLGMDEYKPGRKRMSGLNLHNAPPPIKDPPTNRDYVDEGCVSWLKSIMLFGKAPRRKNRETRMSSLNGVTLPRF